MPFLEISVPLPSKPKIIDEGNHRGSYEIEGLYPGYGHTLGNSLRRIILSSLPGAAVTAVKIPGVDHEFSTLPGVKEDVVTILLALRQVRFSLTGNESQTVRLEARGVKEVRAEDIVTGGQMTVLNPDLHLLTLTDKNAVFEMEMSVEKGLGYVSREVLRQGNNEIGKIFLDAVFTPVRRVSCAVENMRVGDRTDFNRLRINIETDGTVTPREAFEKSIEIMVYQLKAILGFRESEEPVMMEMAERVVEKTVAGEIDKSEDKPETDTLKTRIEDLDLLPRILKSLAAVGIRTAGGLARKREKDLQEVPGLGDKGLQEIKKALAKLDLNLR